MAKVEVRACLSLAFEVNARKFYFGRGRRKEHSQSYVTDAQRSPEQNFPRVGQSVKFKQALREVEYQRTKVGNSLRISCLCVVRIWYS